MKQATWLVTGGTGAFGQAFVRHLLDGEDPRSVRVFSRGEAKQASMRSAFPDPRLRFLVGDVRDAERVADACRGVEIVVHAAALKRIEQCEADPIEAIKTNVDGTWNVARACIERGVQKAVFLSTDKAAAPCTLYGGTKFVAERLWLQSNAYAAGTPTILSATRYGNVLNSTGSVVPIWRQQALNTGSITVTHPGMSRFLMHMDQAVSLVILAIDRMIGGEVFIPKLGAATIGTLTRAVAPHVSWNVVGPRPGEKLHETLISNDEAPQVRDEGDVYVLDPLYRTWTADGYRGVRQAADFSFTSDKAPQFTVEELKGMV